MEAVNVPVEFMKDVVDFSSNAEFMEDEEKAIPWRDVECNIPFKVLLLDEVTTVNGKNMIVKLQKRDNTIVKARTREIIKYNLLRAKACNEKKILRQIRNIHLKEKEARKMSGCRTCSRP